MIAEAEVERFRRIGFDEVLPKPVRAEDLAARIGAFIRRKASARPPQGRD
jgi:DNA-binding response OmpR family regulator